MQNFEDYWANQNVQYIDHLLQGRNVVSFNPGHLIFCFYHLIWIILYIIILYYPEEDNDCANDDGDSDSDTDGEDDDNDSDTDGEDDDDEGDTDVEDDDNDTSKSLFADVFAVISWGADGGGGGGDFTITTFE